MTHEEMMKRITGFESMDEVGWTGPKLMRRMELAWMLTEALRGGADGDGD